MGKYKLRSEINAEQYVTSDAILYLQEWADGKLEVDGKGTDAVVWVGLHRLVLGEYLVKTSSGDLTVFSEQQFNELFEEAAESNVITSTQLKNV